jgi:hypothetical protein
VGKNYDLIEAVERFFEDPYNEEPPIMITFPSLKDRAWSQKHPDLICCQILIMMEYKWFEKFKGI